MGVCECIKEVYTVDNENGKFRLMLRKCHAMCTSVNAILYIYINTQHMFSSCSPPHSCAALRLNPATNQVIFSIHACAEYRSALCGLGDFQGKCFNLKIQESAWDIDL